MGVKQTVRQLIDIDQHRDPLALLFKKLARALETRPDRPGRKHGLDAVNIERVEQFIDSAREGLYQRLLALGNNDGAEYPLDG